MIAVQPQSRGRSSRISTASTSPGRAPWTKTGPVTGLTCAKSSAATSATVESRSSWPPEASRDLELDDVAGLDLERRARSSGPRRRARGLRARSERSGARCLLSVPWSTVPRARSGGGEAVRIEGGRIDDGRLARVELGDQPAGDGSERHARALVPGRQPQARRRRATARWPGRWSGSHGRRPAHAASSGSAREPREQARRARDHGVARPRRRRRVSKPRRSREEPTSTSPSHVVSTHGGDLQAAARRSPPSPGSEPSTTLWRIRRGSGAGCRRTSWPLRGSSGSARPAPSASARLQGPAARTTARPAIRSPPASTPATARRGRPGRRARSRPPRCPRARPRRPRPPRGRARGRSPAGRTAGRPGSSDRAAPAGR